jgi:transglutaminase-like putative cysteine protease
MTHRFALRVLSMLLCLCAAATASAQEYRFAPVPAWVQVAPMPDAGDATPTSDGTRYLLLDDQVDARRATPAWYRRIASRLDHARALADGGQITIDFQPEYQRVVVHAVDVWRNGVRSDRRKDARIQVLRREPDLDAAMFDGEHTLTLTLPDLRVGDIVDYSYSIVGDNPVFGDAYYDAYTARFGTTLAYRRVRALFTPARPLHARAPEPDYVRREGALGADRFVEFTARRLPRVRTEPDAPDSFDPWGQIELTTAGAWRDIVSWALPMYRSRLQDRALAGRLIATLRLHDPDKRAAMARAIDFVEGEIRYTALDMGKNSHEPNAPETVVARRFGDCKDKSVLLVALLHEAGIDAEPVLVDTEGRQALGTRLPSAVVFDHVVVRARLDGRSVWIDPTRDPESGPLADRSPLPFRLGLPICAGCDRLVDIPQPMPRTPVVDVGQHIALSKLQDGYRADFVVVSDYRNEKADSVRDDFADGEEDLGERYLRYMRKYYDDLRSSAAPSIRDRGTSGAGVRATERYTLRWEGEDAANFDVVLFQLLDWLPDLDLDTRRTPLALEGPSFARQTIRTRLAGGWDITPEDDTVANQYFTFHRTVRAKGDKLEIVGEWRRLADQVPAADYAKVRDDVDKVRDLMDYSVDFNGPDAPDPALLRWQVVAGVCFALSLFLAILVYDQRASLRRLRATTKGNSPCP